MNPSLEELASLYVLDQLEPTERAAFEARLLHDPELERIVRELESALAARIQALPRREPAPETLARIEARIDRLQSRRPAETGRLVRLRWALGGAMAALLVASVGFLAFQALRPRAPAVILVTGLASGESATAELPLQGRLQSADARFIQLASLAKQYWEKPTALPVKIAASNPNGWAYALFDPASNQGYIAIQQLPRPKVGHYYHLWVVDRKSGDTRDAGILPETPSDSGLYFFSIADLPDRVPQHLSFFITAEPGTDHNAGTPRGRVVLGKNPI